MENRKISWLEQFASDYNDQLTKTASLNKSADQIIVDRSAYPNAKVGSLVDFKNCKYKIIDTEYSDKSAFGNIYDPVAGQRDIDVKICSEGSDDQWCIWNAQNDPYDPGLLGIRADESDVRIL